jgi:hypothetical protein
MEYLTLPEEDFIQSKEAIDLMNLGFNEPCISIFVTMGLVDITPYGRYGFYLSQNLAIGNYLRPTYSQAFKWFRRKHELNYIIETLQNGCGHRCSIIVNNPYHFINIDNRFDEYEDAELHTLRKMIELVKTDYKSKFFINPQIN